MSKEQKVNKAEQKLLNRAWEARKYAYPWKSGTKVGCAILTENGSIYPGWNIEGLWMTSIHAEVVAIVQLVKNKDRGIAIAIASETKFFTPCGSCLDWLFQFCDKDSPVFIQNQDRKIYRFILKNLCPHYPKQ